LRRTSRSAQILRALSFPWSVEMILQKLVQAANSPTRPLIDLTAALVELYTPRSGKMNPFDSEKPLESIFSRWTHSEANQVPMQLDESIKVKLAFGLHHLHSRIDPIAASSQRIRKAERMALLDLQRIPMNPEESCPKCQDGNLVIDSDQRRGTCSQDDRHSFLICQMTMEPVSGLGSECCFCQAIMKYVGGQSSVCCPVCRIGITNAIQI
jgi:hypothetical protein